MKKNVIYKHKTNRDTAFSIVEFCGGGRAKVEFYNTNSCKMTGEHPYAHICGHGTITLKPENEYVEYFLHMLGENND